MPLDSTFYKYLHYLGVVTQKYTFLFSIRLLVNFFFFLVFPGHQLAYITLYHMLEGMRTKSKFLIAGSILRHLDVPNEKNLGVECWF